MQDKRIWLSPKLNEELTKLSLFLNTNISLQVDILKEEKQNVVLRDLGVKHLVQLRMMKGKLYKVYFDDFQNLHKISNFFDLKKNNYDK